MRGSVPSRSLRVPALGVRGVVFAVCLFSAAPAPRVALAFGLSAEPAPAARNPGPISQETLRVMRNATEILVYTYPEKIGGLQPSKDYSSVQRLSEASIIYRFRGLIEQNSEFQPEYRKRCMPVWDYGVEFRAADQKRTFLFSFRCNTMKVHEDNVFRDFERERVGLYALLRYEVNASTAE